MATGGKTPARSVYKASEVCAIAGLQPYVLRSWQSEFPDLGVRGKGRSRLYRRQDVDRVLRIKELVYSEGLTLGAARRKLLKEASAAEAPARGAEVRSVRTPATLTAERAAEVPARGAEVRMRLDGIKKGLQAILDLLAGQKA